MMNCLVLSLDKLTPINMPPRKTTKKPAAKSAKNNDTRVTENLRRIYENPDGSLPDMKTIDQEPVGRGWRIFGKILFLAVLAGVGYFAWQISIAPRLSFNDQVAVAMAGANSVAPGELATYTIRYRNPGDSTMASAELYFEHQNRFLIVSSSLPFAPESQRIAIGELASNESGEVVVSGLWAADFNSTSTLTAVLSYMPQNFSSVFEKKTELIVAANKPAVAFAWTMPASVSQDRLVTVGLSVKPLWPLSGQGTIKIFIPNGFVVSDTDPKPTVINNYEWRFPTTSPELVINLKGKFTAETPGAFKVEARTSVSSTPVLLGQNEQLVSPSATAEEPVQVTVLGKREQTSVMPGALLPIEVSVTNAGLEPISDARVVLSIMAPSYQNKSILNWQKLTDALDGEVKGEQVSAAIRRGQITWDSTKMPELKNLAPGKTVNFSVSLPIKNDSEITLANFATSTMAVMAELRSGTNLIDASDQIIVQIQSDAKLVAEVEKTTNGYEFTWALNNTFHELKDLKIETDLYGEFTWNESALSVPVGTAKFDSKTKHLTWTISKLPTNVDSAALKFSTTVAKFNPTQIDLTGIVKFTAIDVETGELISFTVPALKNN